MEGTPIGFSHREHGLPIAATRLGGLAEMWLHAHLGVVALLVNRRRPSRASPPFLPMLHEHLMEGAPRES